MSRTVEERPRERLIAAVAPLYSTHKRAVEGVDRWLNVLSDSGLVLVDEAGLARALDDALSAVDDEWTTPELAGLAFAALRSETAEPGG